MSACRSCGALIVWARTVNGKRIPLDADPVEDGNLFLDNGVAVHVTRAGAPAGRPLYRSHFATCALAAEHRRARVVL